MSANSGTYERFIQVARICTAVAFSVSGIGLVVCANVSIEPGIIVFLIATFVSFAVVVILIAEQLLAVWINARRGRISLAALLVMMAASGVFFAIMRNSVSLALVLLTLTLAIISAALEKKRQPNRE